MVWSALAAPLLSAGLAILPATEADTCVKNALIQWGSDALAYETAYSGNHSAPGSELTVVAIVSRFCGPFAGLDAARPDSQYTMVLDQLVSEGTRDTTYGAYGTAHGFLTRYDGGRFRLFGDSPRHAPDFLSIPSDPPNASVPAEFETGALLLEGTLTEFLVGTVYGRTGYSSGSFYAGYQVTGGTLSSSLLVGTSVVTGAWCPRYDVGCGNSCAGCRPTPITGYSAQLNFQTVWQTPPVVPTLRTTWTKVKLLYR